MRFLALGDTHGNLFAVEHGLRIAQQNGCEYIVQAGDYGYWPHFKSGERFLSDVEDLCAKYGVRIWWVDGNHENHDRLEVLVAIHGRDSPIEITPHVSYLPRSYCWEWDGLRFMALGGAYSIDKEDRKAHVTWWPQETITAGDVYRACSRGPVDIMITHDCPIGPTPWNPGGTPDRKKDLWPASRINREALTRIVEVCQPELLIHGHYHNRYSAIRGTTRIEGLAEDGRPGSTLVVDVSLLKE